MSMPELWISRDVFCLRRTKYSGLGLNELLELGELREQDSKRKRLVAGISNRSGAPAQVVACSQTMPSAAR